MPVSTNAHCSYKLSSCTQQSGRADTCGNEALEPAGTNGMRCARNANARTSVRTRRSFSSALSCGFLCSRTLIRPRLRLLRQRCSAVCIHMLGIGHPVAQTRTRVTEEKEITRCAVMQSYGTLTLTAAPPPAEPTAAFSAVADSDAMSSVRQERTVLPASAAAFSWNPSKHRPAQQRRFSRFQQLDCFVLIGSFRYFSRAHLDIRTPLLSKIILKIFWAAT